jgi:predicted phage tail protein
VDFGPFTLDRSPAAPVVTTPVNGGTYLDALSFAATATDPEADDVRVEFELHGNSSYTDLRQTLTGATVASTGSSTADWSANLPSGTYYLRARSVDAHGATSTWTNVGPITINRAPGTPTDLTPVPGSHIGVATPVLTWRYTDPDGHCRGTLGVYR